MTIQLVPGTGYAPLLINAGDGPTMVINRDTVNQLYVGDDNSIAAKQGTGSISIIDPLGFMVFDGVDSKFGLSASPAAGVIVDTVKGATQWAPSPVLIAEELSAAGFPILTAPTLLDSFSSLAISGAGTTRAHNTITQPTYEGAMTLNATAGGLLFCQVDLAWDINGVVVDHDTFDVGVANNLGGTHTIAFRGPTKGNGLTVSFLESSGTTTVTNYQLFQSSHTLDHHDWHSTGVAGAATFNGVGPVTGFAPRLRILGNLATVSIPGSTTNAYTLPLWTGKFSIKANTASNTTDLQITMNGMGTGGTLFNLKSDATGNIEVTDIFMAREQYQMNVRNANAGAENVNLYITADEY